MQLCFIKKLKFYIWKTIGNAQKIDGNRLKTFDMIITSFFGDDKDEKS